MLGPGLAKKWQNWLKYDSWIYTYSELDNERNEEQQADLDHTCFDYALACEYCCKVIWNEFLNWLGSNVFWSL